MKVRVDANGSVHGTKVSTDSGQPIEAKSVSFMHQAGKVPKLAIEMMLLPAKLVAEADFTAIDPLTGLRKKIKRIEYADGSAFEP